MDFVDFYYAKADLYIQQAYFNLAQYTETMVALFVPL
jgi:hypothetical protein